MTIKTKPTCLFHTHSTEAIIWLVLFINFKAMDADDKASLEDYRRKLIEPLPANPGLHSSYHFGFQCKLKKQQREYTTDSPQNMRRFITM